MIIAVAFLPNALLLLMLLFSSSSPFITLVFAGSNSPNGNTLLSYTSTHTCGRNLELVSCHMQSDASNFFCGRKAGTFTRATKFTVSPFSEAATSSTDADSGCALIEATSQFACVGISADTINFYSMANLVLVHAVTVGGAALDDHRALLYFEDYMYALDRAVSTATIIRIKDVLTTPVFDTTFSFSPSGANLINSACISGTDSSNRKIIAQFKPFSGDNLIGDVDISGSSPPPNFAEISTFGLPPEFGLDNTPVNADSMACASTVAYATFASDRLLRFQTIPNLVFLDSMVFDVNVPDLGGLALFGGGQYLLVSVRNGANPVILLDVTKFPGHSIIETTQLTTFSETEAAAAVAIPAGTDPRDGGTFKVFTFDTSVTCTVYEFELKNLDDSIIIPPNVSKLAEDVLTGQTFAFCQANSASDAIFCAATATEQPVRISLDPIAIAATGAVLPSSNNIVACDLGESQSGYYCVYDQVGGVSFRSFNIPSLSTRDTADISDFLFGRSSIAFAEIGGFNHLFTVDSNSGFVRRSNLDATTTVTSDLETLSGGAIGNDIDIVVHCPTETEDKHVFTASRRLSRIYVTRVNGDLSNAAFPVGGYDSHIQIPDANFVDFKSSESVACSKSHIYLVAEDYGKVAKLSISPFAVVLISAEESLTTPRPQGITISFDSKFLFVPSTSPSIVVIVDVDSLNLLSENTLVTNVLINRCVSTSNFKLYCPTNGAGFVTFDVIPYTATAPSVTKTKSLQSITSSRSLQSLTKSQSFQSLSKTQTMQSLTSTRTISRSASLQSLTSTRTVSSTSSQSASASPQSLTSTKTNSISPTLQSLTSTKSSSVSPSKQSLTRTISKSKSPSLQSLTSTRSLSKSSSLQSLTNTRTVSATKTTSASTTQFSTKTLTVSPSQTLQSLTTTISRFESASLQSLTNTKSRSVSITPQSLTATRSISSTLSLQSLTLTRSSSKSVTPISLTSTLSRTSSTTPISRSKSLSLISLTQTQSSSSTASSTVTSSKSKTASFSLQSLTVTQTPFSRSPTLSSTKTTSNTATFTLPPTPSTTRSLTFTRTKTASLQSLSKTKSSSRSLQSLTRTKTKTSLVTPPPATTTTTTTSAPDDNVINNLPPSSNIVNALVVSVPSCPSSLNSKCQVRHPQSNECRCPQGTYERNITLLPSFAFLPSTSATSQLIDRIGNPCVRNEFVIGICTASTSERFISSYTRFGGTTSENGICEQVNPFTNDCSCRAPSTKASFAIATGSPSSVIKKFVTFCLPSNGDLSVFWTIHPDVATSSSTSSNRAETSCVSPNGNVTCECTAGASKTTFGVSIFPDSSSTDPVPGDLTFCKAKPAEPEEEVNIPVTTTGTVVGIVGGFIEGGGANAVVGIQVAALLMTLCDNNPNVSTSGAKSVVVFFEYPGLPPSAGGLAFMLTLTLGVFFFHAIVCFLVGLKRFAISQKIEFDPDKIDYFEEEIETPSFFEQIRFASLQLRFPHWSFFVMNIGFSGVVVESTILLQNTEDDIMVLVGAIGLVLSLIYIALTLYYSYWGIRSVADVTLFDADDSGTTKKLVKIQKKLKKTVAQLTEVPITDDIDDEVFPSGSPPKSRATRSSSSRNNSNSMSRHRARSSSSRKQSSSSRFRSFKAFSSRSNALSSDASSAASSSSDEEQGHKWLNRRKSIQPSSTSSNVHRSSCSRRKSNTASSKKPSSRRSSSQHSRRSSSEVDDSVIVYSDAENDGEEEKSRQRTSRVLQDRKSSTVKMPTDDEDDQAEECKGANNVIEKSSSSSSVFTKRNKQMKRAASNRRNPLRPPPRTIKDDEDTSSAEDLDLDESDVGEETNEEEEEEENQHEQQKDNDNELTDDDKPPHYVKYGKAMKLFHRFCSFSEYILPSGWWIKHRLYNRRYASMYNSFQPRPTAWAPVTIRIFLFSVSIASSLGGCFIPVTYVGTVALLVALMFLVARPCRRPFDNILLALQLILGSTLAFSRSSNPELSVKLFYGVIGVTFVYVFHIFAMELLESLSMSSLELFEFKSGNAQGETDRDHTSENEDDGDDADTDSSNDDGENDNQNSVAAQRQIAKALSSAHSRHEKKKKKKKKKKKG